MWLFTANGETGHLLEDGSSRSKEYRFRMNETTWPYIELSYKRRILKKKEKKKERRLLKNIGKVFHVSLLLCRCRASSCKQLVLSHHGDFRWSNFSPRSASLYGSCGLAGSHIVSPLLCWAASYECMYACVFIVLCTGLCMCICIWRSEFNLRCSSGVTLFFELGLTEWVRVGWLGGQWALPASTSQGWDCEFVPSYPTLYVDAENWAQDLVPCGKHFTDWAIFLAPVVAS